MRHVIEDVFHVVIRQHPPNPHVPDCHAHYTRRECPGWLMTTSTIDAISFFALCDPPLIDLFSGSRATLRNGSRYRSGTAKCETRSCQGENKCENTNNVHSDVPKGMTKRYVIPTVQILLFPAEVKVRP